MQLPRQGCPVLMQCASQVHVGPQLVSLHLQTPGACESLTRVKYLVWQVHKVVLQSESREAHAFQMLLCKHGIPATCSQAFPYWLCTCSQAQKQTILPAYTALVLSGCCDCLAHVGVQQSRMSLVWSDVTQITLCQHMLAPFPPFPPASGDARTSIFQWLPACICLTPRPTISKPLPCYVDVQTFAEQQHSPKKPHVGPQVLILACKHSSANSHLHSIAVLQPGGL